MRRLDGVVALAGFAPRVEGGEAEIDRIVQILEQAASDPAQSFPSWSGRPAGGTWRPCSGWRRPAAGWRRWSETATTPGERSTVSSPPSMKSASDSDIVPGALRDRLGISRKYLIPLLEWADGKGITVRVGETRRLKRT